MNIRKPFFRLAIFVAVICVHCAAVAADRTALVIGNSTYQQFGTLANAEADARSIADAFKALGYETTLTINAKDDVLRKTLRSFAASSAGASISVVFYAGHGAQVDGENYLLPTDIEPPTSEGDIRLSAVKVDDIVNSLRSKIKIIFLDACRDNPLLRQRLARGRGASPIGLAPTNSSNLAAPVAGGGIFIAYATNSDALASDGNGPHSPFTQALLGHIKDPVSLDDMFSLVTKEVRLATKDVQRPYKYASLEGIVCISACPSGNPTTGSQPDALEQARHSKKEDLELALQTRRPEPLLEYMKKYPDTEEKKTIIFKISALMRADHDEWVLYDIHDERYATFMKFNSIEPISHGVVVAQRNFIDTTRPLPQVNVKASEGAYAENRLLYSCRKPEYWASEETLFDAEGRVIHHYKWADPEFLPAQIESMPIGSGSVGGDLQKIVCNELWRTPLLQKSEITTSPFRSLSSTAVGDGDLYYKIADVYDDPNIRAVVVVTKFPGERKLSEIVPVLAQVELKEGQFRSSAGLGFVNCQEQTISYAKTEFYAAAGDIRLMWVLEPRQTLAIVPRSPFSLLYTQICIHKGDEK
jgi:caspase domain-containing protein